jgi:hypothetical protein
MFMAEAEAAGSDTTGGEDPMEEARRLWSNAYAISAALNGTGCQTVRRYGKGTATAADPPGLWGAMLRDFTVAAVVLRS